MSVYVIIYKIVKNNECILYIWYAVVLNFHLFWIKTGVEKS